jgi:hypothetical protein
MLLSFATKQPVGMVIRRLSSADGLESQVLGGVPRVHETSNYRPVLLGMRKPAQSLLSRPGPRLEIKYSGSICVENFGLTRGNLEGTCRVATQRGG